jgi:hypothetical protein
MTSLTFPIGSFFKMLHQTLVIVMLWTGLSVIPELSLTAFVGGNATWIEDMAIYAAVVIVSLDELPLAIVNRVKSTLHVKGRSMPSH